MFKPMSVNPRLYPALLIQRALHSVPVVGEGPAEMIARMCIPEQRGWVLEAEIYASPLSGRFLLLPDAPGLTTFLRGLKMA